MRILSIVGARPQFVKVATIARAARSRADVEHLILHTGQHYDREMSESFFLEMDIPQPDLHLDVQARSHGAMTGRMLEEVERGIGNIRPDVVLVYGDTNSTLAGALAAVKIHIPVAHVEAGLRSFNKAMPEEINRISTDRVSQFLFCPTKNALMQLEREGFTHEFYNIHLTGDVMLDAVRHYQHRGIIPTGLQISEKPLLLCTIHRPSNTDDPHRLQAVHALLEELGSRFQIVFPMHPRLRTRWKDLGSNTNFEPIGPVSYFEMLGILQRAKFVLTDSGGLQKEAYFCHTPCLTLRKETEWVELVEGGFNMLVEPEIKEVEGAMKDFMERSPLNFDSDIYGNGKAAERILDILVGSIQTT